MTDDPRWARPDDTGEHHHRWAGRVDWTPPPHDDPYAWHVREADRLLREAARVVGDAVDDADVARVHVRLRWAQVHATLAQAAAMRAHVEWLRSGFPEDEQ